MTNNEVEWMCKGIGWTLLVLLIIYCTFWLLQTLFNLQKKVAKLEDDLSYDKGNINHRINSTRELFREADNRLSERLDEVEKLSEQNSKTLASLLPNENKTKE